MLPPPPIKQTEYTLGHIWLDGFAFSPQLSRVFPHCFFSSVGTPGILYKISLRGRARRLDDDRADPGTRRPIGINSFSSVRE